MKILLLHQQFLSPGEGGGTRFNELTELWGRAGHEVTVLAGTVNYATGKTREKYQGRWLTKENPSPGVTVLRCAMADAYSGGFITRLAGYFSFMFSSLLAGLTTAGRQDVVVASSPPLFSGLTGAVLARLRRIPYIFEVRDLWPESAIAAGVLHNPILIKLSKMMEAAIYRLASKIVVLTPAFRDELCSRGIPASKLVVIPNAADFARLEEITSDFDLSGFRREHGLENRKVAIYVGAHRKANHLIQVVEAAEELRHRQDILFLLIGGGDRREPLIEEVKKRGLEDTVRFQGPMPKSEVLRYILASDVGMSVLKKADTFTTVWSNKTFDYMACARPVLMVIDGVSRHLVETVGCGVYSPPEAPSQLAQNVERLLDLEPDRLRELGEKGYDYALKHFNRKVHAREYLQLLRELVEGGRKAR